MNSNCTTTESSPEVPGKTCQDDLVSHSPAATVPVEADQHDQLIQSNLEAQTSAGLATASQTRQQNQSSGGVRQSRRVRPVCRFYVRHRYCQFGRQCRFAHPRHTPSSLVPNDAEVEAPTGTAGTCEKNDNEVVGSDHQQTESVSEEKPLERYGQNAPRERRTKPQPSNSARRSNCYFYWKFGHCRYGNRCWFQHALPASAQKKHAGSCNEDNPNQEPIPEVCNEEKTAMSQEHVEDSKSASFTGDGSTPGVRRRARGRHIPRQRKPLFLADLSSDDLHSLRTVEINQLKKRFPHCEDVLESETGNTFAVEFHPSDPDWPFDVDSVLLHVHFPQDYPTEMLEINVVDNTERCPEMLLRHINKCLATWLQNCHSRNISKGKTELIFRPFLRWLDKNLEELFTTGLKSAKREADAKAAGIEFVPFEELPGLLTTECPDTPDDIEEAAEPLEEAHPLNSDDFPCNDNSESQQNQQDEVAPKEQQTALLTETPKSGTEVKFRNLQLGDSAATLGCQKLSLTIQCSRCKTRHEITTAARQNIAATCTKCHHPQQLSFQPSLLHQFSDVVGYLNLIGCQAVDIPLMKCTFQLGCLDCSKHMSIDGIHYGQSRATWCQHCNSKMTVFVDSAKFLQLQPSLPAGTGPTHTVKLEGKVKSIKDPAIQEGKPLPQNGTCRHFKKSHRWLRFPCCGKAYPCDICHEEGEDGHEMKFATRMLCGFCAKEQPFTSDKPCIACHSYLTRRSGSHWEGGLGCRDKQKMSRNDQQKYKGGNKTTPKTVTSVAKSKK